MGMKALGSTEELYPKLHYLWFAGADGIHGVAVECVDIMKNTNGEGSLLGSSRH